MSVAKNDKPGRVSTLDFHNAIELLIDVLIAMLLLLPQLLLKAHEGQAPPSAKETCQGRGPTV